MRELLAKAVAFGECFINRASQLNFTVDGTKVGLCNLKPANGGTMVSSEGSILVHASGKRFIAVWQNYSGLDWNAIGHVVRDTLNLYEGW
jgi:hypothetical protein